MLERIAIQGFKSLRDVDIRLSPLSVFFGPNAAGKSNLLDAIQFLAASGTERSLADALNQPVRGIPAEAFSFPPTGLAGLLETNEAKFQIEAWMQAPAPSNEEDLKLRYRLEVLGHPRTGEILLGGEYLEKLGPRKSKARIESSPSGSHIDVRKRHETGKPLQEKLGVNHSVVSIPAYSGEQFPEIEALRAEFRGWRVYYLEPRSAMRQATTPAIVDDVGRHGQFLPTFLYGLKHGKQPRLFDQVVRMVRQVVPSIDALDVELNEQRAELNLVVRQNGIDYSNRVVSEGTLRVIALAAIALNPTPIRLIGLEEPENGVQPSRIEHIISLLRHLALKRHVQVIVNTHSPIVVAQVLRAQRETEHAADVAVYSARSEAGATRFTGLHDLRPLFESSEVEALLKDDDDAKVAALFSRELLDG